MMKNVGQQAASMAETLSKGVSRLLEKWDGPAAREFKTNVDKVIAFAPSIAHAVDGTLAAPPSKTDTSTFDPPNVTKGMRQIFADVDSDITTYTSKSNLPPLPSEDERWWWKWYDNPLHFNYEVRAGSGDGHVVHGDLDCGNFVDFMNQHSIGTTSGRSGLIAHPLPDGWANSVKAFETKEYNKSQEND